MIEKREHWRKRISLQVKYKIPSLKIEGESEGDNIAETGIHFYVHKELPMGTVLELKLKFPRADKLISVMGEAIWIKGATISGEGEKEGEAEEKLEDYEVGVRFTQMKAADRGRILSYVYGEPILSQEEAKRAEPDKKEAEETLPMEKRKYVRLTTQVHVKYKLPGMIEGESETIDISGTGMRLLIDAKLEGGVIELEINLSDKGEPIFTLGEVIWCKSAAPEAKGKFEIGVQFVGMKNPDKNRIIKYVHSQYKREG